MTTNSTSKIKWKIDQKTVLVKIFYVDIIEIIPLCSYKTHIPCPVVNAWWTFFVTGNVPSTQQKSQSCSAEAIVRDMEALFTFVSDIALRCDFGITVTILFSALSGIVNVTPKWFSKYCMFFWCCTSASAGVTWFCFWRLGPGAAIDSGAAIDLGAYVINLGGSQILLWAFLSQSLSCVLLRPVCCSSRTFSGLVGYRCAAWSGEKNQALRMATASIRSGRRCFSVRRTTTADVFGNGGMCVLFSSLVVIGTTSSGNPPLSLSWQSKQRFL